MVVRRLAAVREIAGFPDLRENHQRPPEPTGVANLGPGPVAARSDRGSGSFRRMTVIAEATDSIFPSAGCL